MEIVLGFIKDFILLFLMCLIIYLVFVAKRKKDYSKLKKNDEIVIFVTRYRLNPKKTNYKKLVYILYIINSFIISFTSVLILNIENIWWSIVICFIVIFVLVYSLFEIAGRYFKKMEGNKNV